MHKRKIIKTFKTYLKTDDIKLTHVSRFIGGMSNFTYHVRVNNQDYVIRIANKKGKPFVSYPTEKLHLFLVEPFGITSKTLFYDTATGIKISEYIKGNNLTTSLSETDYKSVASLLCKLHALKIEGVDYELIKRLGRYEKLLKGEIYDEYRELKAFWVNEYKKYYINNQKVFTHGDAQRSNIVKQGNRYILLDFEFAGMNDPFFDIASFANIDFNDSLILLKYYLKKDPLESDVRHLMFYRLYQVLQWHLVAAYKHKTGQSELLHIDFKKYSDHYLSFARELSVKIKALPHE